ncbi:hypothetical protein B7463_g8891, partial [Scytalidium lignicola]
MSCLECQRRKQKCDRQWPCNRCQGRKVAHLCKYDSKTIFPGASILGKRHQPSQNQRTEDDTLINVQSTGSEAYSDGPTWSLKSLGYMEEDLQAIIGDGTVSGKPLAKATSQLSPEVKEWLREIPPRPYTDHLIISLENDLGDTTQAMTERYHSAAEHLNRLTPLGDGNIEQVQQLLLSSAWFKGEGRIIESWHVLSEATRIAQEIGLHKESESTRVNDFEHHMRQRTWCNLYFADAYMSAILNRPAFINQKHSNFSIPDIIIDIDPDNPDVPPPLECRILEFQLAKMLSRIMEVKSKVPLDLATIYKTKTGLDAWILTVPSVFSSRTPDTHWDAEYPYIPLQRINLHVLHQMTLLMLLKPVVTQDISNMEEGDEGQIFTLQQSAIASSISVIRSCRELFDKYMPTKKKFYSISFYPFDCATNLCRILLRDKKRKLPNRKEIISGIQEALFILNSLQNYTAVARRGKLILDFLVAKLQLFPSAEKETSPLKRQRRKVESDSLNIENPVPSGVAGDFETSMIQQDFPFNISGNGNEYSTIDLERMASELVPTENVDLASLSWIWDE